MDHGDSVLKEFLIESRENLDQLDRDLVALEQDPRDPARLASIFRTIHTIKGTCGFLGLTRLEAVTHVAENLLSRLRDGVLLLNAEITTALLALVDTVREILTHVEQTGTEGERDDAALIATLTRLQDPPPPSAAEASPPPAETEPAVELPPPAPIPVGDILVATGAVSPAKVLEALRQQAEGDPRPVGEILLERGEVQPQEVSQALRVQEAAATSVSEGSVRVDVGLLDKLMNLVGELVLARNQILQFTATQRDAAFLGSTQRLNLITTELQEGVMKTRMQPIGNVWNRFPRVVRDLARQCGKRVRVEMEGKETELDRTIIEAIKDPLTHVVRNAVDHGIEPPEARLAAGKPAEGLLALRAYHEGGQVNIEISDDGAGIDPDRIRAKALERGLITREQAARMSDRECVQLVFLPGFSTAQAVTNVSGRGVGMDVVKTNIEKIGGTVDIQSHPGQGTTLKIKIPLTLAIIPALIVTSGGERYAIPQVNLLELVRLEGEQAQHAIEQIHGAPVYRLRGHLLPLVYLNRELGLEERAAAQDGVNIVVLQADDRQFGLVVEGINDTEEIVVKPLSKQLKNVSLFAGATIMGDGRVALILDVLGVAQRAGVISELRDRALAELAARPAQSGEQLQSLLVLSLGEGHRAAIPLELVARLEEIDARSIELADGAEVVQYRGRILPLVRLAQALGYPQNPSRERETLQVVVYSEQDQSVGLVVERILDIVEVPLAVERASTRPGVCGSAVIQNRVTDLVDVRGLMSAALARPFSAAVAV
jgi:two-component system chemotaxis sensor kinase CheA